MWILLKQYKNYLFFLSGLIFILYGNSLKNKYGLDDDYVTVTNFPVSGQTYIPNNELAAKGFKGIGEIWKSRYAHDEESSFDYRPVTSTFFAIEYGIFGQNPFISHLINIMIYAITICVMFCVLLKLFEAFENKFTIAFLTSFIFVILPIHTEAVNNIKSRDELLAFLFPLICLWYCLKAYDKLTAKDLFLILLFFLLGLLSKKTAMVFLGVIPLSLVLFRKINFKKNYIPAGILLAVVVVMFLLRRTVLSEPVVRTFYHFENPMFTDHFSIAERIMAGLKTLGFYIKFSFIPYPFRNYYGTGVIDISGKADSYFFISLVFLAACGWYFYKTRNKLFLFGVLLFLGGIFPFSNIIPPVAGVVGERLAYNASFGFAIAASILLLPLFKSPDALSFKNLLKKPLIYFAPIIVTAVIIIWSRNTNWKDKVTLFEHDIPYLKKSAKANSLLANEYFDMLRSGKGKYTPDVLVQKALFHYEQAIKNDSSFFSAYNNAGVIYYSSLRDIPKAKTFFKLAIRHRPVYPQAYENLGNCFKEENNIAAAYKSYLKAIDLEPKQYSAYTTCIKMLYDAKRYDEAATLGKTAMQNFPDNYALMTQHADCLFMLNKQKEALATYTKAYHIFPNQPLGDYLASKYLETGDTAMYNLFKRK